jgi:hypothetical protein
MRYRPLSDQGDYTIDLDFLYNSPACVAQAVQTRLLLYLGEWFLDTTDGTPWFQNILGKQFNSDPNTYIKQRILGTPNVTSIVSYNSIFNGPIRTFTVTTVLNTAYGQTSTITVTV